MPQSHLLKKTTVIFNHCSAEELGAITIISGAFGCFIFVILSAIVSTFFELPVNPYAIVGAIGFCMGALVGTFKLSKIYAVYKVERPEGYYRHLLLQKIKPKLFIKNIKRWGIRRGI